MYDGGDIKETHPSYISEAKNKDQKIHTYNISDLPEINEFKRKPIIICGDLNVALNPIDLKNPQANQNSPGYSIQEREAFKKLLDSGFVDTFRELYPDKEEYTWWSYRAKARERNVGWRIDYFLISEWAKDKVVDSRILTDVMGSDHCPVLLDIDL